MYSVFCGLFEACEITEDLRASSSVATSPLRLVGLWSQDIMAALYVYLAGEDISHFCSSLSCRMKSRRVGHWGRLGDGCIGNVILLDFFLLNCNRACYVNSLPVHFSWL